MYYNSGYQPLVYQPPMPVFGILDELPYQGAWLNPKMYEQGTHRREYSPRSIKEDKYTHKWTVKERDDGRTIEIGQPYDYRHCLRLWFCYAQLFWQDFPGALWLYTKGVSEEEYTALPRFH